MRASKSGVSITDFRAKNVTRVSNLAALAAAVSLASRIYSEFFGPHIRSGFERLTTDLGDLVRELPGSITLEPAIELVDNAIASLRDAFSLNRTGDRPATSEMGSIAVAAMSIPESHYMVQQYLKTSLQALLVASSRLQDSDQAADPTGCRQKALPPAAAGAAIPNIGDASLRTPGGQRVELDWDNRPTITGVAPCFSWASKTGRCRSTADHGVCLGKSPFPHSWDSSTSEAERVAFLAWLSGH